MFNFFIENELVSPNQSGDKPSESCINQLLAITHEIYKSFDNGFEVSGVFLEISKAFDKFWHKGLIFKSKQNGISGNLLNLLCDLSLFCFLRNRKQRVLLNWQGSDWSDVRADVPQGSILGPLLFWLYINYLSKGLPSNAKLFVDDMSLFSVIHDSNISALALNSNFAKINRWTFQWKMICKLDPKKQVQEVIFSQKSKAISHPPTSI